MMRRAAFPIWGLESRFQKGQNFIGHLIAKKPPDPKTAPNNVVDYMLNNQATFNHVYSFLFSHRLEFSGTSTQTHH